MSELTHEEQFNTIDATSDARNIEESQRVALELDKMAKVRACEFRKHAGFYNIKCIHPDRSLISGQLHRQCLSTACPVI